ncbi:PAS domain-containing protein [Aquimarina gracilis]|uniref:PAS domain-containing protein n=1 Tax=Aquimarina gracilis TaxID=874422 RepID=A0ABU5ZYN9_9FLAO|nr:PAS domain-containing protein [Aquimarina gracilis]MEB3346967.1 PAS domain-containing protein [Aquimarina gracilis]
MKDLNGYDHMMAGYYKKMSNYSLPLLSWEFYGESHAALEIFKDDINNLNKLSKNWDFNKDYYTKLIEEQSVIIVTSPNLEIVYASKNIEKLNGYSPNEVIGNSPKMFQGEGTCEKTSAKVRDAINNGVPFEVSILNYRKDTTTYMCTIKGYPVHDKKGKLVNYIAFEKAA